MTDLTTLKARVDEAETGSRDLDALVLKALAPECIIGFYTEGDTEPTVFHAEPLARQKSELAHYTTSVDAALALIEAKLPGYDHVVGVIDGIPFADVGPKSSFEMVSVKHKTKPLAAVSALLAALIAKEQA